MPIIDWSNDRGEPRFCGMNALDENELTAIRTLYRAIGEGNPALLEKAVAPDWQDIPLGPGQEPGPRGFGPVFAMLGAAFPDLAVEIDEILGGAGHAAVRARMTGTHRGPIFGIPATNKPISIRIHEVHHLSGGRITHTFHMEDWLGFFQQIGAFPVVTK